MKQNSCPQAIALAVVFFLVAGWSLPAAGANTTWTNTTSGLWADSGNWDNGAPANNGTVTIGNAGDKTVTIDAATPAGNLTITNLVVTSAAISTTNTLSLSGNTTPLTVLGTMTLGNSGNQNGALVINGGQLVTTNAAPSIGNSGIGTVTVLGGSWLSRAPVVGNIGQGTLILAGGTNQFVGDVSIAQWAPAKGTVMMTGGMLVTTNSTDANSGFQIGRVGYGSMTVSGGVWLADYVSLARGIGGAPGNAALAIAGGSNVFSSGFRIASVPTYSGCTGTVTMTGGSLSSFNLYVGSANYTNSGSFVLSDGAVLELTYKWDTLRIQTLGAGTAVFTNQNGGVLQFTDAAPTINLIGNGVGVVTNAVISYRNVGAADINNANVAKLTFQGDNTFQLNNATNLSVSSYAFDSVANTGNPTNYQGLALVNGGYWRSTRLTIGSGGALIGDGTIASANLTNLGTVAPGFSAGLLTITNNLVLGPSSILEMEIGGTGAADYDRIIVGGNLSLTGALHVVEINSFVPTPGDMFTLIDNQGLSSTTIGQFDGLPNGASLNAYYTIWYDGGPDGKDVVLIAVSVIPEPSALMLCGLASLLLLVRRQRT